MMLLGNYNIYTAITVLTKIYINCILKMIYGYKMFTGYISMNEREGYNTKGIRR